jgi:hypothetical protein
LIGIALLGYAAGLLRAVRRGRTIPKAGYLVLLLLNVAIVAVVVAWFVGSAAGG